MLFPHPGIYRYWEKTHKTKAFTWMPVMSGESRESEKLISLCFHYH